MSLVRTRQAAALAAFLAFLASLWSCRLTQEGKVENTASFDQMYETLSQFDTVIIVFKDSQGNLLDTVFQGKVDSHSKIHGLEVKGWDGGQAQILISGFNGGRLVYQVDKRFDGTTNQTDANIVLVLPDAAIQSDTHDLQLAQGDTLKYPSLNVGPSSLSDKTVIWTSSDPEVLAAGPDGMKALKPGAAELTAHLKTAQAVRLTIAVTVRSRGPIPESLRFDADTLYLIVGGGAKRLGVRIQPSGAGAAVSWSVEAPSIAKVDSNGNVSGLSKGVTKLIATSKENPALSASAAIVVGLDTLKPKIPILTGPASTNLPPAWHWAAGGGDGSGDFRFKLGDSDFTAGATLTRDTSFTLKTGLVSGATYTLFVAERDLAGNWSDAAKHSIKYDLTKPIVAVTAPAFSGTLYTSSGSISLSGTATGPSPISTLTYSIGNGPSAPVALSSGSWTLPGIVLTEGMAVSLTLTATDDLGNTGSLVIPILMDNTPPAAPAFVITPATPTRSLSGAWTWTPGTDGASGSGLNGHFRYALNNGSWKDTTGLGVENLVLSEGANVFAVQEQDRAGNWSVSATGLAKVDLTPPALSLLSHANPAAIATTHLTFAVSASDSGSGMQSVTVSGQTSGSGVLTNSAGTWTSAELTLKGGANTLSITATDQVGNSRNLSFTVNVNLAAASVVITDPSGDNALTNADSIDVSYTIDGTPGKKRFGLSEGANNLVVSSSPNASGAVGKDSVKVIRDATAPKAPTLAGNASITNGTATWTWTSNGDNTGGAGVKSPPAFRYSFNGGTTWTTTSSTSVSQTAEGVYALVVQEQDKADNWSASSAAKTISVDKTAPVVTIQTPNNSITNKSSITINYTEQDSGKASVPKTKSVSLATDDGPNSVTISSTADAAGNVGTASITVYRRSKVVFVKTAASGAGDGSSWENAAGGLESGIAKAGDGGQIWLAAGTYITPSASGFKVNKSSEIYGGFNVNGVAFSLSQRDSSLPYKTVIAAKNINDTIFNVNSVWTDPVTLLAKFVLNGMQISGNGTGTGGYGIIMFNTAHFEIRNCVFQQLTQNALNINMSQGVVLNCLVQNNFVPNNVVEISLTSTDKVGVTFQQCVFQRNNFNTTGRDSGRMSVVYFFDGGYLTFDGCSLLDTFPSNSFEYWQLSSNTPYLDAVVTFKNSTVTGGLSKIFHPGTLNYTGLGNNPP